jgi:hypothetical protein
MHIGFRLCIVTPSARKEAIRGIADTEEPSTIAASLSMRHALMPHSPSYKEPRGKPRSTVRLARTTAAKADPTF